MPFSWLIPTYAVVAILYLATPSTPFRGKAVVKATPILLLCLLIASSSSPVMPWVVLALLFSAAGDVALEVDGERLFIVGLAFFLIAHLFYVVALMQNITFLPIALVPLILIGLIALLLTRRLLPKLGSLHIPVTLYISIIVAMGVAAALHSPFNVLIVVGAIVFMLSDATIAVHKFLQPVPRRDFVVMATYYAAQFLLVMGFLFESS